MLEHGGDLTLAIQRFGRPAGRWLDLSTGINPHAWPVPPVPEEHWQALPGADDGLKSAACQHFGFPQGLPVAGTQAALQMLPTLRPRSRVAIQPLTYAEHAACWTRQGHEIVPWSAGQDLSSIDVLVVVNPNNPTGEVTPLHKLWAWHAELAAHGGWLIVDEAFMDATPTDSLLSTLPGFARKELPPGLIVLRGLGKFFGLAGARVGFVGASPSLLEVLEDALGPWTISGPSRWLAIQALRDVSWQESMRHKLTRESERLRELLTRSQFPPQGGTALFQWVMASQAQPLQDHLAHQGIWVRHFPKNYGLRFGLPGNELAWQHLAKGLSSFKHGTGMS